MDSAERIAATLSTPGWQDIEAMIDEKVNAAAHKVMNLLVKSAVKLTKDDVLKLSAGVKALTDFRDEVKSAAQIWPQPKGGQTDGTDGNEVMAA